MAVTARQKSRKSAVVTFVRQDRMSWNAGINPGGLEVLRAFRSRNSGAVTQEP